MKRLFVIIGRINSILFLIILLGAGVSIALMMSESNRWQRRGAVEVPDGKSGSKKPILVSFEKIENITGANVQMLQLTTKEKSEKFSSGGHATETRNVLFLAGTEKAARWLFKDHNNLLRCFATSRRIDRFGKRADTGPVF